MRELVGGSRTRACGYQRAVLDPAELANLALEERKPWRAVCSQPVLKHRPSAASSFARGQPSIIMDDTEEAQAWIEAVTHDPFDDSLSFLANLKTGARRGVPAISRAPRRRRPLAGAAVQADQRNQAR